MATKWDFFYESVFMTRREISKWKCRQRLVVSLCRFFLNTIFVSSHMYPENHEGTQVIVGSLNMGYISDTARNRTHNLFCPKREPIPLCHSDAFWEAVVSSRPLINFGSKWTFSTYGLCSQCGVNHFIVVTTGLELKDNSWLCTYMSKENISK